MALKNTINELKELLDSIQMDLEKAVGGNKAASQRVRTGTVTLEKVAKQYRKESITSEKRSKGRKSVKKKTTKTKAKAAPKTKAKAAPKAKAKAAPKAKAKAAPKAKAKAAPKTKAKPKAKAKGKTTRTSARARAMSVKRPTAKLPTKRRARA